MIITEYKLIQEYEELHHFLLENSYYDMTLKQRNRYDELKSLITSYSNGEGKHN